MTSAQLLEIKSGQWRAGVWIDDDACWVVAAGLAKGGHRDRDDFYKTLERQEDSGSIGSLLPAREDRELLKRERASAKVHEWQLGVQERLLDALVALATGGNAELVIPSASPRAEDDEPFATIELAARTPEDDYPSEDVTAEFSVADRWKGTQLRWHFTVQVLATICPPEEGWDTVGGIYSTLLEPCGLARRAQQVRELHVRGEIARSAPGTTSLDHLTQNLAVGEVVLDVEMLTALETASHVSADR